MIEVKSAGSFAKTEKFLGHLRRPDLLASLERFGEQGVSALSNATPTDTSETANSWYYEIVQRKGYYSIVWHNRHVQSGIPIAVLIQYGHATRNGGWVEGEDFINPALKPIFDQIAAEAWKVVTK